MFQTSHLQELKRRYREMYLPKPEELDEHCGVCGEGGEHGIEEGKPSRKLAQRDVGMECQECGKKFRAKLSTLQYGKTKCPKCKSTDLDFAYGESVEVKEDSDKDEPGTQGDQAEYQKKRKEITAKFGVKSCSELEGEKKKACYAALDAAHVSDDEEEDEDDDPVGKNEEVIPEGTALQVKMALSDVGLKGTWKNNKVYVKKRDVEKAKKALKGNVIYRGKPPVVVGEEIEIDEKRGSGYDLYHKTFSAAMQHAYAHAKKKGVIVDPKEIDDKVATGPKKPSSGKTNRYILGTNTRKKVHIQVANLDNKRYELNMYIESKNDHLGKVKNILERMKPEEVEEAPSPNQAAIDRYLKKGGKITKYTGPDKKKIKKDTDSLRSTLSKMGKKEREDAKKSEPSRRYVQKSSQKTREVPYREKPAEIAQHYKLPDYIVHDDIKKFPRILTDGINKMIPERYGKFKKYVIDHQTFGKIPGLGVILPGDSIPKLMIQWNQRIHDPKIDYIWADPKYAEKGTDPSTYRKNDMIVWINEAATNNPALKGKVDWYQRKEFEGATPDDAAKRTLQYLKTKIKRMAKEEFVIEREMTDAEKDKREEIVLSLKKKTKDFKERYGDKWKEVMYATATKMAMGESEEEPKSKKKDKINLKPKMDEKMKTYKDLIKGLEEKSVIGETPNLKNLLKQYKRNENKNNHTENYLMLAKAFGTDAEVKKVKEIMAKRDKEGGLGGKDSDWMYKNINPYYKKLIQKEDAPIKEGVTEQGVEYGEQDWDLEMRPDALYPNLNVNFAEFMESGLEGPYLFKGEHYFFDRKINGWYSMSSEDYVSEAEAEELHMAYNKHGLTKAQFSN